MIWVCVIYPADREDSVSVCVCVCGGGGTPQAWPSTVYNLYRYILPKLLVVAIGELKLSSCQAKAK